MKKLKWFVIGYTVASLTIRWSFTTSRKMGIISVEKDPEVLKQKMQTYAEVQTEKWTQKLSPILDRIN